LTPHYRARHRHVSAVSTRKTETRHPLDAAGAPPFGLTLRGLHRAKAIRFT
jgi:hypothetical protein